MYLIWYVTDLNMIDTFKSWYHLATKIGQMRNSKVQVPHVHLSQDGPVSSLEAEALYHFRATKWAKQDESNYFLIEIEYQGHSSIHMWIKFKG